MSLSSSIDLPSSSKLAAVAQVSDWVQDGPVNLSSITVRENGERHVEPLLVSQGYNQTPPPKSAFIDVLIDGEYRTQRWWVQAVDVKTDSDGDTRWQAVVAKEPNACCSACVNAIKNHRPTDC